MAHVPNAKPDITARGITAAVHVWAVPNIRGPGHRNVQTYRRVITQPAVIPVVIIVQVKASVQVQHIVRAESNITVHLGTVMRQPQVKQPLLLVQCWCRRHITWLKMPVLQPPVEQEHGIHRMNVHMVHPVVVTTVPVAMTMVPQPVQKVVV